MPGACKFPRRILERDRVPVDVIAGTSIGSFVDGLCASGMSVTDIENRLMTVKSLAIHTSDSVRLPLKLVHASQSGFCGSLSFRQSM
jgi:predicted acylesterase/phospholipase RssA